MKRAASSTIRSTALWTALIVTLGVGASACSSEKEDVGAESGEVMAVDRVDAAAALARKNGPVAEDMDFPETEPMPMAAADGTAVEGAATTDATMTDAGTAGAETATTDGADGSVDGAASADTAPVTDAAAVQ